MPVAKSALFRMDLRNTASLINGNLFLFSSDDFSNQIFDAVATSGLPGNQGLDDIWVRGNGPIPNLPNLKISTEGVNIASNPGIRGMFFPIIPFTFRRADGHTRSDFGVHFDANVPGSAGCIVIRNRNTFDRFTAIMNETKAAGIETIPLRIEYT